MKDALGHGSMGKGMSAAIAQRRGSSGRTDLMRSRIALAPGAQFSGRRPSGPPLTSNQVHLADLRDRLSNAQGPGHAAALMQGIRNVIGGFRSPGKGI